MADHIDGRLHVERAGDRGVPMLFAHCNPMDHTCWLYQMAHLQTWFRTVGVDLPGYGRSPRALPGLTMADVAAGCWEALDEVSGDPAVLVGSSVGSRVVFEMAAQRPQRTLALVMAGTGYQPQKTFRNRIDDYRAQGLGYRYEYARSLLGSGFRDSELAHQFARMFVERNADADLDTICEMFGALGRPAPERLYDQLKAPTLIISGSEDMAHEAAHALHRRVAHSEMAVIPGAGHACQLDHPWEFDAVLLDFLARHGLGPALPPASPPGGRT